MTVTETSREFDITYDNISSSQAPGLNSYEKSVLLTKAQDEIVRVRYSPFNLTKKGFEGSENRRVELKNLITPYSSTESYIKSDIAIDDDSLFFKIPSNVYYILQEEVTLTAELTNSKASTDTTIMCIAGKKVEVVPTTHDEYSTSKKNPFRKPNKRKVWRMDIEELQPLSSDGKEVTEIGTVPMVEIISEYNISEYKMRYIRQPSPIVLETFENNSEYDGLGLTVNGVNTVTACQLSEEIQKDIIDRAVELAILGYRENTLQANVELNKRNI